MTTQKIAGGLGVVGLAYWKESGHGRNGCLMKKVSARSVAPTL